MEKTIIVGHKNPDVDSVVSCLLLEKKIKNSEFIIPDEYLDQDTYNLLLKYGVDMKKYQKPMPKNPKLFLVDHAITHFRGDIVGIIDHHNTVLKIIPKFFINENSSSTAFVIYKEYNKDFTKKELELIVLATLVDTASFHSTKTNKEEIAKILKLVSDNKFDYEKLYNDGLCLTPLNNLRNAAFNGYIKMKNSKNTIASSYVQLKNLDFDQIRIMKDIVKKEIYLDSIDMYVFMVHDMKELKTNATFISKDKIVELQFDRYTSRKEAIEKYKGEKSNE